ncbi:SspB family protein [Acidocella sp.]|uniref:SspB family protein n=2 Tax=Acidocella sp. TaxID=50710 RepID=UPI002607F8CA|nr:ClpXP protease specificity-enhancing factor SspB [Acidocella sp.]
MSDDDDDLNQPESLLPYDEWTQEALRQVVVSALRHAAAEGLPGGHHFYITFRTDYPGVQIPDRLRAQYPEDMTIVLQHQFHSLTVDDAGKVMSVGLSFSGIPSTLVIPLAAISAFADPEVRFGLHFEVTVPEPIKVADIPAPEGDDVPARPTDGPADVVSLDAFRRRQKD